ncbi:uncharacterized protein LY79DRAFT_76579 [Colletotrichum navitas]|uniref:Uncharacterized protein n=1 Tax=Colletotrichum navitas TaxID=681940 RepID=A0AAD8V8A1_9PEZI|nr:uncharacterized protein LY79DRAFT_76579 [Colletotrichum navitas]KAK1596058.1 hypothetical protein LY79DRAFT_76579 [Colletotrichum navitas]
MQNPWVRRCSTSEPTTVFGRAARGRGPLSEMPKHDSRRICHSSRPPPGAASPPLPPLGACSLSPANLLPELLPPRRATRYRWPRDFNLCQCQREREREREREETRPFQASVLPCGTLSSSCIIDLATLQPRCLRACLLRPALDQYLSPSFIPSPNPHPCLMFLPTLTPAHPYHPTSTSRLGFFFLYLPQPWDGNTTIGLCFACLIGRCVPERRTSPPSRLHLPLTTP